MAETRRFWPNQRTFPAKSSAGLTAPSESSTWTVPRETKPRDSRIFLGIQRSPLKAVLITASKTCPVTA
jgi:hypothetical protein